MQETGADVCDGCGGQARMTPAARARAVLLRLAGSAARLPRWISAPAEHRGEECGGGNHVWVVGRQCGTETGPRVAKRRYSVEVMPAVPHAPHFSPLLHYLSPALRHRAGMPAPRTPFSPPLSSRSASVVHGCPCLSRSPALPRPPLLLSLTPLPPPPLLCFCVVVLIELRLFAADCVGFLPPLLPSLPRLVMSTAAVCER